VRLRLETLKNEMSLAIDKLNILISTLLNKYVRQIRYNEETDTQEVEAKLSVKEEASFDKDVTLKENLVVEKEITAWNIYGASDRKHKSNIDDISEDHVIKGLKVQPRQFTMGGKKRYGFIAQELEAIFPEIVESVNESKAVGYQDTIAILWSIVQSNSKQISDLEQKIQEITKK
jgi:hypothetical protein